MSPEEAGSMAGGAGHAAAGNRDAFGVPEASCRSPSSPR